MILLEHNTFYLRDGVPFVRARMDGGSYTEKDDTIISLAKKAQKPPPPPRMSNLSASGADFCTHFARSGGVCANVECMVKYR